MKTTRKRKVLAAVVDLQFADRVTRKLLNYCSVLDVT
uniref:Uncharacterized protein n=1 Tax=Arundo donax TaxID=35708 RepID=A0A0A8Y4T8_ARUDO